MKERYLYYFEGEYYDIDLEEEMQNLYIEGRDELPVCIGSFTTEKEKQELIEKHNIQLQK